MDGHNIDLSLIAEFISDDTVDAALIHVGLHGISISRRLVAGSFEGLHAAFPIVPLIGQAFALNICTDAELFSLESILYFENRLNSIMPR